MSTTPLTHGLQRLYDLIVAAGRPVPSARLAELYGCTPLHLSTLLRRLRERGLVAATSAGRGAAWAVPDAAQAERNRIAEARRRPTSYNARRAAYQVKYRERLKAELTDIDWENKPMRQIIVPAHECPPIRPPAPASVFNLAHSA